MLGLVAAREAFLRGPSQRRPQGPHRDGTSALNSRLGPPHIGRRRDGAGPHLDSRIEFGFSPAANTALAQLSAPRALQMSQWRRKAPRKRTLRASTVRVEEAFNAEGSRLVHINYGKIDPD
jgi:hypothetical protein